MKKLILLIALLIATVATAQFDDDDRGSKIGLQITQDGKLFVMEDNHGNKPVTWDVHTKLVLEAEEREIGHWQVGITTEYADLKGGSLFRFGAEAGYEFTKLPFPFTNIKYSIAPLVGYGMLFRFDERKHSWEFSTEINFVITKNVDFVILNTFTERWELTKFGAYNLAFGVQINLDTNYLKTKNGKTTRF